jgi:two-component system nitrogen regulation response regulator GlnG
VLECTNTFPRPSNPALPNMTQKNGSDDDSTRSLAPARGHVIKLLGCTIHVVQGPDTGRTLTISGRAVVIGKGADCDLRLTDISVSRRHVSITPCPSGLWLEDLGSKNGTLVDGLAVRSAFPHTGCSISIGESVLKLIPSTQSLLAAPSLEPALEGLTGSSAAMQDLYGLIRQVAPTEATVILKGETGTGKELAAQALHARSKRAGSPVVLFDCGNIDREILGSELFGHRRGAFTGAREDFRGAFERANGGTLFLDEVGELPLEVQSRLLGVLQRREVRPLGSEIARSVDVRIVAATHRDLEAMVVQGAFREDLYYRLAVVTIAIPPLRDRLSDIPQLVDRIVEAVDGVSQRHRASAEFLAALAQYSWPGNVRQLWNLVERSIVMAGSSTLLLPQHLGQFPPIQAARSGRDPRTMDEVERETYCQALQRSGGNKARAARELGVSLATMKRKAKEFGLDAPARVKDGPVD